jgi:hypothetical protein
VGTGTAYVLLLCSQNFSKTCDEFLLSIWKINGFKDKTGKVKYETSAEEENPVHNNIKCSETKLWRKI